MNQTTTFGIITIVGLVVIGNIASVAVLGQEMSETQKLTALKAELAGYGYDQVRDLTADGSQVEFRGNVVDNIAEDTLTNLTASFGFELVDFTPAPQTEYSMITVDMNRTLVL